MGGSYSIDGVVPVVHPSAFVHPDAILIGDVHVRAGCYVGPGASLRGDMGHIEVGQGSNVQDNCVLHCFPGRETRLGPESHVGHGAVLHGCELDEGVLVGINAVVMDGVRVGARSFIGAHSFVPSDFVVAPGTLVAGTPARVIRELSEQEMAWKANGTAVYAELAVRSRETMHAVRADSAPVTDRPRLAIGADRAIPLRDFRRRAESS
jgi:phenylacetic acid degradation protein